MASARWTRDTRCPSTPGSPVGWPTPADLRREVLGQSAYEVEAAGDLGAIPFLLGSIDPGLSVAAEGPVDEKGFRTIKLKTLNADDAGEAILRAFASEGLRVRVLSRAHPTLEDVFLAAPRRSWRPCCCRWGWRSLY